MLKFLRLSCIALLFLWVVPFTRADSVPRLVVLAPDLAYNLIELGASDSIVGIIDNPALVKSLPNVPVVGDYQLLNAELILSLRPDYLIVWQGGNSELQLNRLESLGLNLVRVKADRLEDLPRQWRLFGDLLGRQKKSEELSTRFTDALAKLDARHKAKVRVFYQLWHSPLMSVNKDSLISQILTVCGAENVMGSALEPYPQIGAEAVLANRVDLILAADDAPDDWQLNWIKWPTIPAVKQDQLYTVETDYLHQLTNDTLKGISQVCTAVERARNVNPSLLQP